MSGLSEYQILAVLLNVLVAGSTVGLTVGSLLLFVGQFLRNKQ